MFASIMRGTKYFTQRDRRDVVFLYFMMGGDDIGKNKTWQTYKNDTRNTTEIGRVVCKGIKR